MKQITPFLWFDDNAEEAVNFYTSVFKDSKIQSITRYDEATAKATRRDKDSLMTAAFQLNGQEFIALNGGPQFKFTEAVSFVINCENQKEVDYYWEKLTTGGDAKAQQCGWLKDKYGLSWQVVPTVLSKLLRDKSPKKSQSVIMAMLQMKKIDIAALEKAYTEG
jgi:predicted 3-demethylubiquinone-9 3-methyltransferase (glyoxalase superfamily)